MTDCNRYIVTENIERFETLLRGERLDERQRDIVRRLLSQARAELAQLDEAIKNSMATS